LLKQEEIRTWKKIEETKKRTKEISDLKQKNEEKVAMVSILVKIKTHGTFPLVNRAYQSKTWQY
jgi:hypothetical protein